MIDQIFKILQQCDYDYRQYTNPLDPLAHLFDEWEDNYRLKWSIAKVVDPKSILEIGVRYGYSAISFLDAAPQASYTGIDLDVAQFGGEVDAIDWAKRITAPYETQFIIGDSQEMHEFPAGMYDLIHVDGAQNGDSTYRDLEKAILQGRYILVDGYFWTKENLLASSVFMKDYKHLIEYSLVIPGYAGELLIKADEEKVQKYKKYLQKGDSLLIQELYQSDYYLESCGGYQEYKANTGKGLLDPLLATIFQIADVQAGQHVLDAGCGRGEIAYACASVGGTVDAVDYSESAISLTEKCFEDEDSIKNRVNIQCADITTFQPSKKLDRVIAGDLIEHLSPDEVDRLYDNIAKNLKDDGLLAVHTFPNLWFYQYGYTKKRKQAVKAGGYLSPQPRSYYEQAMHINEQSPKVLKKQLEKHFKYVLIWFGDPTNPLGSLVNKYGVSDCINASDLYALASNSPIDLEGVKHRLSQNVLTPCERLNITCSMNDDELSFVRNSQALLDVVVFNGNDFSVKSVGETPVHLSYHWVKDGDVVIWDGKRTKLHPLIVEGGDLRVKMNVIMPQKKGLYELQVTMVQEGVAWFDSDTQYKPFIVMVNVT
ncbi:hypothetical protein GCM10011332_31470 [Terasakiella brassicae]|uniref:Methyltransferase domain-containing protein n=1 Tax=Terasakiella brassicae TaxID=1634917 RepID=A0A917FGZ9_9PROT|nr:methyltransferase domain-containing protein [Terasakiella brassicae]GGF75152.1 hypothetical protein GCM10011332_31470 [Terasakiella brassicae]